jgi:hypothetical protein
MPYADPVVRREKAREYSRLFRERHPERWQEIVAAYRLTGKEKNRLLMQRYGITDEQYRALEIAQQGECYICGSRPKGKRLHVEHDHDTGRIRGLACYHCNTAIAMLGDSPESLRHVASLMEVGNRE